MSFWISSASFNRVAISILAAFYCLLPSGSCAGRGAAAAAVQRLLRPGRRRAATAPETAAELSGGGGGVGGLQQRRGRTRLACGTALKARFAL